MTTGWIKATASGGGGGDADLPLRNPLRQRLRPAALLVLIVLSGLAVRAVLPGAVGKYAGDASSSSS